MSQSSNATSTKNSNGKRKQRLLILAAVVVFGSLVYGAYYFLHARYYEETDDAYVASDTVQITSEIPGTVSAIAADNTQQVQRGQVLVELDPADAKIAVSTAEADLAKAVRNVRALFAKSNSLRASINSRQLALQAARADLQRRLQVAGEGGVSNEELQHARDQVAQLEASVSATTEELETNNAQIDNTTLANHPQVLAAASSLRQAMLSLRRTHILSPVTGTVARRTVEIGSRISAGLPLMAVVPLDNAWVEANFKEVQLNEIRVGQPAEVTSDMYGKSVVYHGKVAGLGAGSGAAFSLLPPQNASGNWIKIVQRVPVRIALDPKELADHPLRVGLSMKVVVDLHNTQGPLVATQVRGAPQKLMVDEQQDSVAEQKIHDIIKHNSRENKAASGAQ